jgi:hypothetical protein
VGVELVGVLFGLGGVLAAVYTRINLAAVNGGVNWRPDLVADSGAHRATNSQGPERGPVC